MPVMICSVSEIFVLYLKSILFFEYIHSAFRRYLFAKCSFFFFQISPTKPPMGAKIRTSVLPFHIYMKDWIYLLDIY